MLCKQKGAGHPRGDRPVKRSPLQATVSVVNVTEKSGFCTRILVLIMLIMSQYSMNSVIAQAGEVLSWQKISATEGNFTEDLDEGDHFGSSVATIGDLNGDGIPEVAVGAPQDDDGKYAAGAVYVLFLDSTGHVDSSQKISATTGGFNGTLDVTDYFGNAVAGIGDVDNDGIPDLAVGCYLDDDGEGDAGAVYILFLNADGTVDDYQKISDTQGSLGIGLNKQDYFGTALAATTDWDENGVAELLVGASGDNDGGGPKNGAIYILFLDTDGTVDSTKKISESSGGWSPHFGNWGLFGSAIVDMGDIDGDGNPDIAIAPGSDYDSIVMAGGIYIVFLEDDYAVKDSQKISLTSGGFDGNLEFRDHFGIGLANWGDQNDDGINDLLAGVPFKDEWKQDAGAFYILYLDSNGSVDSSNLILPGNNIPFFNLDIESSFGYGLAVPGDLDGNGVDDIFVGAPGDEGTGSASLILMGPDSICADMESCGWLEGMLYQDDDQDCSPGPMELGVMGRVVEVRNSKIARRANTDTTGRFSILLPAGDYDVFLIPAKIDTFCDTILSATVIAEDTIEKNFFRQSEPKCTADVILCDIEPDTCSATGQQYSGPCKDSKICYTFAINNNLGGIECALVDLEVEFDPAMEIDISQSSFMCYGQNQTGFNVSNTPGNTPANFNNKLNLAIAFPNGTSNSCGILPGNSKACTLVVCVDVGPNGPGINWAGGGNATAQYQSRYRLTSSSYCTGLPTQNNPNCVSSGLTTGTPWYPLWQAENCACDPNGKAVLPVGCGSSGFVENDTLHYSIFFENVGGGPATDIVIRDTLDSDLDTLTIAIDTSSHTVTDTIFDGYKVTFRFDSIMLPGKMFGPAGNKGFIKFSVKPKLEATDFTLIENRAGIVFDDWPSFLTNTVSNTIHSNLDLTADIATPDTIFYGFPPLECDTLQSEVNGGVQPLDYDWNPGSAGDTNSTLPICPTDTTIYTLLVTDSLGCWAQTAEKVFVVDVHCGATNDSVLICWDNEEEHCVDSSTVWMILNQGGSIGPCESDKSPPMIEDSIRSFEDEKTWVKVFPNPVQRQLNIRIYARNEARVDGVLLDMHGKKIRPNFEHIVEASKLHEITVDISDIPAGIYVFQLQLNSKIYNTWKIIKN